MKVKKGYSGLESFSLSFASNQPDLLKLPGNDAKMGLINHLFSVGEEEEAKKMFRQALNEITGKLDKILEERNRKDDGYDSKPGIVASLSIQES